MKFNEKTYKKQQMNQLTLYLGRRVKDAFTKDPSGELGCLTKLKFSTTFKETVATEINIDLADKELKTSLDNNGKFQCKKQKKRPFTRKTPYAENL